MAQTTVTVFHATPRGNGQKIEHYGWKVSEVARVGQAYGRGIYFWELIEDAHTYGELYCDGNYDIVAEEIPLVDGRYTYYDENKRNHYDPDALAQSLLNRGIHCLVISRAYMDRSTMIARGKAYVWLININGGNHEIKF